MRLRCSRSNPTATELAIVAVESIYYGPDLEVWKKAAAPIRASWELLDGRIASRTTTPVDILRQNIDTVFSDLDAHDQKQQQGQEQQRERREVFEEWTKVLRFQENQLAAAAHPLAYSRVEENEQTLSFTLIDAVPEDLPWEEGAILAVQAGSERRVQEAGSLLIAEGNTVIVNRDGNNETRARRATQIASKGELLVHVPGEATVIQRQKAALRKWRNSETVNPRLVDVLTHLERADFDDVDNTLTFLQADLAEDKRSAVRRALAARDIFLLQGPPGTGKTTVIAELILQILRANPDAKILVSSQSNVAVDNALSRVATINSGQALEVVRLGRDEKSGQGAEIWRLDQRLAQWRQEVVTNCNMVLDELREEGLQLRKAHKRTQQSTSPAKIEMISDDLNQCRDWLDEAAAWTDALHTDKERFVVITQLLNLEQGNAGTLIVMPHNRLRMIKECKELEDSIGEQRTQIVAQLEAIRLLMPAHLQGDPRLEPTDEMDRLSKPRHDLPGLADIR